MTTTMTTPMQSGVPKTYWREVMIVFVLQLRHANDSAKSWHPSVSAKNQPQQQQQPPQQQRNDDQVSTGTDEIDVQSKSVFDRLMNKDDSRSDPVSLESDPMSLARRTQPG
jgi:hypothetical protein